MWDFFWSDSEGKSKTSDACCCSLLFSVNFNVTHAISFFNLLIVVELPAELYLCKTRRVTFYEYWWIHMFVFVLIPPPFLLLSLCPSDSRFLCIVTLPLQICLICHSCPPSPSTLTLGLNCLLIIVFSLLKLCSLSCSDLRSVFIYCFQPGRVHLNGKTGYFPFN